MHDKQDFQAQWQQYQARVDDRLEALFARLEGSSARLPEKSSAESPAKLLVEAMAYSSLEGGKRFRPVLVYASGQCFGAERDALDAAAMAVELIHAYSLVHDDLPAMDDDDLRRGKPSCHIQFDEATAILVGDALQTLAFEVLASTQEKNSLAAEQRLKMLQTLAAASGLGGMAGGQALDITSTGKVLKLPELQQTHELKTGALIRAALKMGAMAAPSIHPKELEIMDEYGRNIGLAFQVVDDILDVTQNSEQLGKQSGRDAALNKNTYPALMGLEAAKDYAAQLVQSAQQNLSKLDQDTEFLALLADFTQQRNF